MIQRLLLDFQSKFQTVCGWLVLEHMSMVSDLSELEVGDTSDIRAIFVHQLTLTRPSYIIGNF